MRVPTCATASAVCDEASGEVFWMNDSSDEENELNEDIYIENG